MKIANIKKLKHQKVSAPLFTADIELQLPFENITEKDLSISYVHFSQGAQNKFHKHSTDQVLIVTDGKGFVATREKIYKVKEGDIVWTPAGEVHKHGALPGQNFTHISITRSKSKLTQEEK